MGYVIKTLKLTIFCHAQDRVILKKMTKQTKTKKKEGRRNFILNISVLTDF